MSMQSVQQRTTGLYVHALLGSDLTQILTFDANNMNVCLTQNVPPLSHAKMRSVSTPASAPEMQIVHLATIGVSVLASQDSLEILMV